MTTKFWSFEMIFDNGSSYKGNLIFPYGDIQSDADLKDVENRIKNLVNLCVADQDEKVALVTLTNWKTL